jgi:hypothetical protein
MELALKEECWMQFEVNKNDILQEVRVSFIAHFINRYNVPSAAVASLPFPNKTNKLVYLLDRVM